VNDGPAMPPDPRPVTSILDRSLAVGPTQHVESAWVDIDLCSLGCRDRMCPEAVVDRYRLLLQQGERGVWPPPVGHWDAGRFRVCDGRHEYLASLMLGRTRLFVCWLADEESA
jgi:hypothetical protein